MRLKFAAISMLIAAASPAAPKVLGAVPAYTIEQAVAVVQDHNPEILIARKKVLAARGGFIEARSGFLPSLSSSGLYDKRQTQNERPRARRTSDRKITTQYCASNRTFTPAEQ